MSTSVNVSSLLLLWPLYTCRHLDIGLLFWYMLFFSFSSWLYHTQRDRKSLHIAWFWALDHYNILCGLTYLFTLHLPPWNGWVVLIAIFNAILHMAVPTFSNIVAVCTASFLMGSVIWAAQDAVALFAVYATVAVVLGYEGNLTQHSVAVHFHPWPEWRKMLWHGGCGDLIGICYINAIAHPLLR
jgi:hypothetical protein